MPARPKLSRYRPSLFTRKCCCSQTLLHRRMAVSAERTIILKASHALAESEADPLCELERPQSVPTAHRRSASRSDDIEERVDLIGERISLFDRVFLNTNLR